MGMQGETGDNYDGCDAALAQFSLIKDIRAGKQCQTWATWLARHKSRYNITAAKHKRATPPSHCSLFSPLCPLTRPQFPTPRKL